MTTIFLAVWLVGAALAYFIGEIGISRVFTIGTPEACRAWVWQQRRAVALMSLFLWPVCLAYAAMAWIEGRPWEWFYRAEDDD